MAAQLEKNVSMVSRKFHTTASAVFTPSSMDDDACFGITRRNGLTLFAFRSLREFGCVLDLLSSVFCCLELMFPKNLKHPKENGLCCQLGTFKMACDMFTFFRVKV